MILSEDSPISQANIPPTRLMFGKRKEKKTGMPLGQVVLNGRVSYCHITALGDWGRGGRWFCCQSLTKCCESVGCTDAFLNVVSMENGVRRVNKDTD